MELVSSKDYNYEKFENEDFIKDIEDSNFKKCVFRNINFSNCDLSSLYFENCSFFYCDFSNCIYSKFASKGNEYISCKLVGINFDDSHLESIVFKNCCLKYSSFAECILNKVNFLDCDMQECGFINLKKFNKLNFIDCKLIKADFFGTKLDKIDFRTCDISSLKVRLEDLKGVIVTSLQAVSLSTILGIDIREIGE